MDVVGSSLKYPWKIIANSEAEFPSYIVADIQRRKIHVYCKCKQFFINICLKNVYITGERGTALWCPSTTHIWSHFQLYHNSHTPYSLSSTHFYNHFQNSIQFCSTNPRPHHIRHQLFISQFQRLFSTIPTIIQSSWSYLQNQMHYMIQVSPYPHHWSWWCH